MNKSAQAGGPGQKPVKKPIARGITQTQEGFFISLFWGRGAPRDFKRNTEKKKYSSGETEALHPQFLCYRHSSPNFSLETESFRLLNAQGHLNTQPNPTKNIKIKTTATSNTPPAWAWWSVSAPGRVCPVTVVFPGQVASEYWWSDWIPSNFHGWRVMSTISNSCLDP